MHLYLQICIGATEFLVCTADSVAIPLQSPSWVYLHLWWRVPLYIDSIQPNTPVCFNFSACQLSPAPRDFVQTVLRKPRVLRNPGLQQPQPIREGNWWMITPASPPFSLSRDISVACSVPVILNFIVYQNHLEGSNNLDCWAPPPYQ